MQHVPEPRAAPGGADERVRAAHTAIQQAVQRMRAPSPARPPAPPDPVAPPAPRANSLRRLPVLPRGGTGRSSGASADSRTPQRAVNDPAPRPMAKRLAPDAVEPASRRRFRMLPRVRTHPRLFRFF